ncbi:tail length tape measure protein [Clostridium phage phiCP39-O]|uniref:tail length tape measure protein n=1 Tax=Clostridium phage phiCP39-O TaxID=541865 RepID=UPI000181BCF6|nr:tail length tape measure protein [Clostridium phage phiCP39-O]ACE82004.1 tape measure protein [Clostridium phage phiCP39-O]
MNLFTLMAEISIDNKNYNSKIDESGKKTESVASRMGKATKAAGAVIAGGLGVAAGAATKVGMDFEASMDQVAATMGIVGDASDSNFKKLSDAAKQMGATTKYSASESAEALNYLALAGYDTDKAISALPKVLNLAAAGGIDLAYASDLVTDSMSALGIETDQLEGFTDQMAKTSQKANTNVAQLGEAILTVGGTAKSLKGGTVELNTQLGILADNGIKGAEGGTALRNIILSLGSPTDKAAKLMKKLGLEVYDASGNMRGTNEIFKDLNKILGTMTEQERTKVLSELFNKVDLKSANALLANSGERFDELSKHIANSQGSAEEMAKTMSGNLKGAMDNFKSALEGLGIAAYEKFSEPLTNAVKFVTDGISWLVQALQSGNLDGILNNIGLALSVIVGYLAAIKGYAIVSGIIAFVKPLFTALKMVKSFSGAMAILNAVFMANPIGIVIGLVGALAGAFIYLWNTSEGFRNFWINLWDNVKEIASSFLEWITNVFATDWSERFGFLGSILDFFLEDIRLGWEFAKNTFINFLSFFKGLFTGDWQLAFDSLKNTFIGFGQFVDGKWQNIKDAFKGFDDWLQGIFTIDWSESFGGFGDIMNSFFRNVSNIWTDIKGIFNGIIDFVAGTFTGNWSRAWQGVKDIFGNIMSGLVSVIKAPLNGVIGLVNSAISGLNSISVTIPDWIPMVGGKHFGVNLPKVPYLYNGGIVTQPTFMGGYVAGDSYKGRGNQAEAVIPLDKLENWIKSLANRPVEFYIDGKEMMRTLAPHQSEFDEYSRMTSLAFR